MLIYFYLYKQLMTENMKDDSRNIITSNDYEDANPVYQRIKNKFKDTLKDKYNCENFDDIVDYVFNVAFKKRTEKSKCIEKFNSIFKDKTNEMVNYLWNLTRDIEKGQENDFDSEGKNRYSNYKRGGKPWADKYRSKGRSSENRQKYKNKRERSRSYSKDRNENKFEYENYQNYPMRQKGFYPPKGTFGGPMMPIGGGYPAYYPPQMMPPYMR